MSTKLYSLVTGVIFALVALGHLLRLLMEPTIAIGSWQFPVWMSVVALIVTGFLSYEGFRVFWHSKPSGRMAT